MFVGQEPGVDRFAVALAFEAFGELLAAFGGIVSGLVQGCLLGGVVLPVGAGNGGAGHHIIGACG